MKHTSLLFSLFFTLLTQAQEGYEIRVTLKPFHDQYIYLGHYFGDQYPIVDSARLDANGQGVFRGNKKLPGGIYLVGYPNKAGFFEILVDKNQHFSVMADTATLREQVKFDNSPENKLFAHYQRSMGTWGRKLNELQQQLKSAKSAKDSAEITKEILKTDAEVNKFRHELIKDNPETLLAVYLKAMKDPELPEYLKKPATFEDSTAAYRYFKDHFWDDVYFFDGRLAYTPFFGPRVDKYFSQLVVPDADSVIKEIDWMMGYASISPEMSRFLLIKFANRYLNQKYMFEDKVFVHLFEKYFANKDYDWLTAAGKKTIADRAYSLMANITGTPAADVLLPNTQGKSSSLYEISAPYTIVAFWDPRCGHCREVLPRLDSLYRSKWKADGVKVFAIAKETDGTREDWLRFIAEHKLQDWNNVYYSKAAELERVQASIPGYSQLYDVQNFPTLYLLDNEKRIIAKKLTYEQIDDILELRKRKH